MGKLGERIRQIRKEKKLTQAAFADLIGVHPRTLIQYEKGRMLPGSGVIENIIKKFKVEDLGWFLKGGESGPKLPRVLQPIIHPPKGLEETTQGKLEHYRAIPLSEDGRLAAGGGGLSFDENHPPDSMVWVYEPEIRRPTHNLQAVRVGGHSMEETIPQNSIVVLDLDDRVFVSRQIYVVRKPEAGLDLAAIKRVQKGKGGFFLISDNPKYPPEPVEGMDWNELVVGRAIWMWRSLIGA